MPSAPPRHHTVAGRTRWSHQSNAHEGVAHRQRSHITSPRRGERCRWTWHCRQCCRRCHATSSQECCAHQELRCEDTCPFTPRHPYPCPRHCPYTPLRRRSPPLLLPL